jgi:hypothetical protein
VRLDAGHADAPTHSFWYMTGTPPCSGRTPGNFRNDGRSLMRSSQNLLGRRVRAEVIAFSIATSAVTGPAPSSRSR